jgi:TolB-like protein
MRPVRQALSLYLISWLALSVPGMGWAQQAAPPQAGGKELIAVMDLGMLEGTKAQGAALTNQLRSEVLKTGKVTLVDRSQMEAVLQEQALQQSGCTSQECAVDVGKVLGIRKIVTGSVTKISDNLWQVSVQMIDVETSETVRAETFNHRGVFDDLLFVGMANVAKLLFPPDTGELKALVEATPPPPAAPPPPVVEEEEGGIPWWVWALGVVGIVAIAAASGGGGGGGGGGGTTNGGNGDDGGNGDSCPSASGCGSIGVSW